MNNSIQKLSNDYLFRAVLSLKNMDECRDFFEDLCTAQELKAISQRIIVAKMLSDKRVYSDIVKETSASTATISRVNRSLVYGNDSFRTIFPRLPRRWDVEMSETEFDDEDIQGE
ncbi:MAG: YerC/YecD family TrpR-related protein [Oscillospiraceae bacterium]|nr:YerC/YecD family TrpR-related protein [Oscillospiraceae bacterium]